MPGGNALLQATVIASHMRRRPSSGRCLKPPNSRLASMCSTLRVGLAISRRPRRHVARPHKDWIFLQQWSAWDAVDLPHPDSMFHAAVSSFGMHHVPRPQVALAECRRVLKPGARIAVTVWATPDENIAWSLVFDAVARHGNRSAADAPPPGALNRPEQCLRALEATDFIDCSAAVVRAEWLLPSADGLVAALSAGTVRMAALIAAQEPSALAAMINDIAGQAERFRRNGHLAIPIAAVLARGRKSTE